MPRKTIDIVNDLRAASKVFVQEAHDTSDREEKFAYVAHAGLLSEAAGRLENASTFDANKIIPPGVDSAQVWGAEFVCEAIADGSIDEMVKK